MMEKITQTRTEENIRNLLIYSLGDIFTCINQIISSHPGNVADYCKYFLNIDDDTTYEKYIHLVACYCLLHSDFIVPGSKYEPVDFIESEQNYDDTFLSKIKNN